MSNPQQDRKFMAHAIELAQQGQFTARPNPTVGCVIVQNDHIVGSGYHVSTGQPHAEINALAEAKERAKGATAYVTLEPCNHHGRTPPCTQALIRAGIKRVVIAQQDPNPRVDGQGRHTLEAAGIDVTQGIMSQEAEALNKGFNTAMRYKKPFVRCKMAMSLDGRTAMASGESKWITGTQARQDVQYLRAQSGAIITGIGTVLTDNPQLTVRSASWPTPPSSPIPQPVRVIVDSQFQLSPQAKLLGEAGDIWWAGTEPHHTSAHPVTLNRCQHIVTKTNSQNKVDLPFLLDQLYQNDIYDVLIESGPTLAGAFIQADLVDELWLYIAPCLMGSSARPLFNLPFITQMQQKISWTIAKNEKVGQDLKLILTKGS